MRVVFFGTPEPAVVALEALRRSRHQVAAVVTQPDRPRGRSGNPQPSPVKLAAEGLPVLQPETPKAEGFAGELRGFRPDALAVVAYGHLLPLAVLEVAPAVNAHFSLLPKYRGAAPVQRAILNQERETGVTTFLLEPTMDSGPVLFVERITIGEEETAGELLQRLAPIGAELLVRSLDGIEEHSLTGTLQDASLASPAPKIRPEEARLDWLLPAPALAAAVRAFNPSPGAWTTWRGRRLKIWRSAPVSESCADPPGRVIAGSTVDVCTGSGLLSLRQVQLEGGRRMSAEEFARGHGPIAGELGGDLP